MTSALGVPDITSNDTSKVAAAVALAQVADKVILALGTDLSWAHEGHDSTTLKIPDGQVGCTCARRCLWLAFCMSDSNHLQMLVACILYTLLESLADACGLHVATSLTYIAGALLPPYSQCHVSHSLCLHTATVCLTDKQSDFNTATHGAAHAHLCR